MGAQSDYFKQQAEIWKAAQQQQNAGNLELAEALRQQQSLSSEIQQRAMMQAQQSRHHFGWSDAQSLYGKMEQKPTPYKFDEQPKGLFIRYKPSKLKSYHWVLIVALLLVSLIILELS